MLAMTLPHNWDEELRFIAKLLAPEMNCVQAGANLGVFPIAFARWTHFVFCVEPQLETFEFLEENIKLNQVENIRAVQAALGKEKGEILCPYVEVGRTDVGLGCNEVDGYPVPLITIDALVERTPIHFIQLDVEGMEVDALEGAKDTILWDRPILFIEDNHPERLRRWLAEHNYSFDPAPNNNVVCRPCPE